MSKRSTIVKENCTLCGATFQDGENGLIAQRAKFHSSAHPESYKTNVPPNGHKRVQRATKRVVACQACTEIIFNALEAAIQLGEVNNLLQR